MTKQLTKKFERTIKTIQSALKFFEEQGVWIMATSEYDWSEIFRTPPVVWQCREIGKWYCDLCPNHETCNNKV